MKVEAKHQPTLTLIYLPHLDYVLQKEGPGGPHVGKELGLLDALAGKLIDFYEFAGAAVIVLSEYGIAAVDTPVHLNRVLRQAGLLQVRTELGRELLDAGASKAFAVADHQIAHVYLNDVSQLDRVKALLAKTPGVGDMFAGLDRASLHLDHPRAGDLVVLAKPGAWFTYYYWLDDARMPDFARTVEIHRKPGYDPIELFLDPKLAAPKLKIAGKLLKKKLGFRYLMDVIPTDASLVRGSHGLPPASADEGPLVITRQDSLLASPTIEPTAVFDLILAHLQR
jgi:predicted AlkP superfamily pyrophosphatase or phosphodiesterase